MYIYIYTYIYIYIYIYMEPVWMFPENTCFFIFFRIEPAQI